MNRETSLYLDAVRFTAALLVAIYHSDFRFLIQEPIAAAGLAHSAVITFFVLSGFVIAHVTATKETTARSYAVSRIARIYSVAIPALLITMAVDTAGQALRPEIYADRSASDSWAVRLATSLVFLNEVWSAGAGPCCSGAGYGGGEAAPTSALTGGMPPPAHAREQEPAVVLTPRP